MLRFIVYLGTIKALRIPAVRKLINLIIKSTVSQTYFSIESLPPPQLLVGSYISEILSYGKEYISVGQR